MDARQAYKKHTSRGDSNLRSRGTPLSTTFHAVNFAPCKPGLAGHRKRRCLGQVDWTFPTAWTPSSARPPLWRGFPGLLVRKWGVAASPKGWEAATPGKAQADYRRPALSLAGCLAALPVGLLTAMATSSAVFSRGEYSIWALPPFDARNDLNCFLQSKRFFQSAAT